MVRKPVLRGRRALSVTLLCAAAVLMLAAVPVQVTGSGIDLYALLCAAVLLLAVERTVGDWIANLLGPAGTALAFAVVAAGAVAYLLSDGGQKRAQRFMAVAEAHGYRPAYFKSRQDEKLDEGRIDKVPPPVPDPPVRAPHGHAASAPAPSIPASPASERSSAAPERTPGTSQPESGWTLFSSRAPRDTATARLTTEPDLALLGDELVVRFRIIGNTRKPPSDVSFFANGVLVARAPVHADGTAEARWRPLAPGHYQLIAETSASSLTESSYTATVQVLPRAR